jgi:hydrogenase maturation factor
MSQLTGPYNVDVRAEMRKLSDLELNLLIQAWRSGDQTVVAGNVAWEAALILAQRKARP